MPLGPYRADFLVEDQLVVECDGIIWHTPDVDARRDAQLKRLGYPTVRLTGRAIHADIDGCINRVRKGIEQTNRSTYTSVFPLTPAQRRAVDHQDGPSLVVAPAGSGKTRVVAERVQRMVESGADPSRVCAISYTKAAVKEMEDRLTGVGDVKFATLHSFGNQVCQEVYGKRPIVNIATPGVPTRWKLLQKVLRNDEYMGQAQSGTYWVDIIYEYRNRHYGK